MLRDVLRRRRVDEPAADLRRPARVGTRDEWDARDRGVHRSDRAEQLRRTLPAVGADRVGAQLGEAHGHL